MSDYKRNPRGARRARKSLSRKALVVLSMMMVLVFAAVGGTIAWLTATTDPVTNTFTVGDIDITLVETPNYDSNNDGTDDSWQAKLIPGNEYLKDPKVTVLANSEPCWLFVKFTETGDPSTYLDYSFNATGWTKLEGEGIPATVYYREVESSTADNSFYLLTGNTTDKKDGCVKVKDGVTKKMIEDLQKDGAVLPELTFQAYACQKDNVGSAADAWAKLNPPTTP